MSDGLFQKTAAFFRLDDTGWERHANPWSVYTRIAIWPALVVTLWSFHWIGVYALIFLVLIALWAFINPRAFPPPASTKSWASRAVLGERVYLARARVPVRVSMRLRPLFWPAPVSRECSSCSQVCCWRSRLSISLERLRHS